MIEIEKKFSLTEKQKKKLLENAEFLSEKILVDVYYDTPEYALTKNDIWLRNRNGQFELKLPLSKKERKETNQYHEIEGEDKIRQIFDITPVKSFLEDIQSFGYASFCKCKTIRREYRKERFTIDLDEVDFGDFQYSLVEIELMVGKKEEIKKANDEILAFAESLDLNLLSNEKNVRGKVLEYLFHRKPEHYQALIEAEVAFE